MSSAFYENRASLQQRWKHEWKSDPIFDHLMKALNSTLSAVTQLCNEAQQFKQSGRFSTQGLIDEVRTLARSRTVPVLQQAKEEIENARKEAQRRKTDLVMPKPDPTDVAGALLRSEMRGWLKSRRLHENVQTLLSESVDERLLMAAMEVPPQMAGLAPEVKERIEGHLLKQRHGKEFSTIEAIESAAELVNSAVETGLYQLRQEAGFAENGAAAFEQWLGGVG